MVEARAKRFGNSQFSRGLAYFARDPVSKQPNSKSILTAILDGPRREEFKMEFKRQSLIQAFYVHAFLVSGRRIQAKKATRFANKVESEDTRVTFCQERANLE